MTLLSCFLNETHLSLQIYNITRIFSIVADIGFLSISDTKSLDVTISISHFLEEKICAQCTSLSHQHSLWKVIMHAALQPLFLQRSHLLSWPLYLLKNLSNCFNRSNRAKTVNGY